MKHIAWDNLGLLSKIIQEKRLLNVDVRKKNWKRKGKRLLKKFTFLFFGFTFTKENQYNSSYPHRLANLQCGQKYRLTFLKAPSEVIVLGIETSDGKSVPSFRYIWQTGICSTRTCFPVSLLDISIEN
jgi:hypothetical protein